MIYCVEDERNIRELIVYTLESSGFTARGLESGKELNAAIAEQLPDLILLDIMLPGEDGLEILSRLKASEVTKEIPVIMVTAKGAEYDKVMGLDCGADDYITKPFGMMEFIARVRAVLRRAGKEEKENDVLETGDLQIQVKQHQVLAKGEKVTLTLKEFELLKFLMENKGIVLTRDRLLGHVWGYDFDGETRTVDVHVRTLRQKLGECGELIETVRGVGYRTDGDYKTREDLTDDQVAWLDAHPDFDWDKECEEAKKVADAIKADGWTFASHTWGHIRVGDKPIETIQADTEKWLTYVAPLIGGSDIIIFAHGQDLSDWHDYTMDNEKFAYLKSQGFNIYCNVDSSQYFVQVRDNYLRMGRRNLDGYRLYQNLYGGGEDRTSDLFDSASVIDPQRPTDPSLYNLG